MKRKIILFSCLIISLLLVFAFSITASAATIVESGSCGTNVTYTLDSDGLLTVSGTGEMKNNYWSPWGTEVKSVIISTGVTSIGNYAFEGCTGLTSITIPDSVTSIGNRAFYNCTELTSITIPDSVTSIGEGAFRGCTGLTSITIPDSVTSIGESAFYCCTGLTSVTIPDSVTSIGWNAFYGCTGLEKIEVASENTVYHSSGNCLIATESKTLILGCKNSVIPTDGSVTSIRNYAFEGCTGLTNITIPDSVTNIGGNAFYCCYYLKVTKAPFDIVKSGVFTSSQRSKLKNVSIDSIDQWCSYDFTNDSYFDNVENLYMNGDLLTTVTISDDYSKITADTFKNIKCIEKFEIDENSSLYKLGTNGELCLKDGTVLAFPYLRKTLRIENGFDFDKLQYMTNLESVSIAADVEEIPDGAFKNCVALKEITVDEGNENYCVVDNVLYSKTMRRLYVYPACKTGTEFTVPSKVVRFSPYAFANTKYLEKFTIPDTVTMADEHLFYNSTGLKEITLNSKIRSIGDYAFANCSVLEKINYNANQITSLSSTVFNISGKNGQGITVTFGDNITTVPSNIFYGNNAKVTDIYIGSNATSIGSYAFYNCLFVKNVHVGENVSSFGSYAFCNCSSIEKVYIADIEKWLSTSFSNNTSNPLRYAIELYVNNEKYDTLKLDKTDSVSIKSNAFYGFKGLSSVDIKANSVYISDYAFSGSELKNLTLTSDNGITVRDSFENCTSLETVSLKAGTSINIYSSAFNGCKTIKTVSLTSDDTLSVGSSAFCGCASLVSVNMSDAPGTIGSSAFNGCSALNSLRIGNGITSIGSSAFKGCSSLEIVIVPVSVTKINSEAFADCKKLKDIYILNAECIASDSTQNTVYKNSLIHSHAGYSVEEYANLYGFDFDQIHIGESEKFVSAKCTDTTEQYEKCKYCDEMANPALIPAIIHAFVHHEAKAPTCTEIGWDAYDTCSRCDYTTYVEKAALGHNLVNHEAKAPTCTEIGWDAYDTCSRCDYTTYVEKAALGHDFVNHKAKAPTCTEIGWDAYDTCSRCDYTTYIEKAALGHKAVTDAAVAPTCTKTGLTEGSHCSVCNTVIKKQETVKALGHDFTGTARTNADGSISYKCTRCNEYGGTVKPAEKKLDEITGTKRLTQDNIDVLVAPVEMTASTVFASANGAKLVAENGKEVTNGEKPLATGMKVILGKTSVTISVAGDVDGSGDISVSDARLALRAAVKLDTLIGAYFTSADVDFSGDISVSDARLILRAAVQLDDPKKSWIK